MSTHGGDIAGYMQEYRIQPLDFSANISPLGISKKAAAAAAAAIRTADAYPDPHCRALRAAISEKDNLPAEAIVCGNGAADLIYRIAYAKKPKQALLTAPCFFEYEAALTAAGCSIVYHTLLPQEGYRVTKTLLDAIQSRIDILFLCQPNNPTGLTIEGALMLEILNRCRQKQVMLVADECFVDFLSDPKAYSLCEQMEHNKNLIVLKAFTKFYGMAGLRLGYALGYDEELLKAMREAGQPWNVSSVAQAAGIAALQDDAYALKVRNLINTERPKMIRALKSLGLKCLPSAANFIFFTCEDIYLEYKLKKAGIMIRSCADYRGLSPGSYRVAIRKPSENRKLLAALREALHEG